MLPCSHAEVLSSNHVQRVRGSLGMPKLRESISEMDRAMPGMPEVEFVGGDGGFR